MVKIKATCEQLDIQTDKTIPGTVRLIGFFDTVDEASSAAFASRKENETVHIYNAPVEQEEEISALEMAEKECDWNEMTGNL